MKKPKFKICEKCKYYRKHDIKLPSEPAHGLIFFDKTYHFCVLYRKELECTFKHFSQKSDIEFRVPIHKCKKHKSFQTYIKLLSL